MSADSIPTQAVVVRESQAVGQALGVNEILAQVKLIQDVMKSVMHEGEHFGKVPGCGDKKVLLQPGAQKLTMTFRLCPEYEIQETDLPRGHKEYRVICTLKSMASGSFVGQGVGCCSSMESKYRWRGGARKCPQCGSEAIIKGKKEYGGGWLCFAKRGGCGAKWDDGAQEIESQEIEKVENDNPADTFNTVLKMAKKRAFVDATITATAASDIFTQDVGDDEDGNDTPQAPQKANTQPATPKPKDAPKAKPAPKQATPAKAADVLPKAATEATRKWFLTEMEKSGVDFGELHDWAVQQSFLIPNEALDDWPLHKVPTSRQEFGQLLKQFEQWQKGNAPQTKEDEPWRSVPIPGWSKHVKEEDFKTFGDLPKEKLWWWCVKWQPVCDEHGKVSTKDFDLRQMLDEVNEKYSFSNPMDDDVAY